MYYRGKYKKERNKKILKINDSQCGILALYNDTESILYSYKFNRKKCFEFRT